MMNELELYSTFDVGQGSLICMGMFDLTNDSWMLMTIWLEMQMID